MSIRDESQFIASLLMCFRMKLNFNFAILDFASRFAFMGLINPVIVVIIRKDLEVECCVSSSECCIIDKNFYSSFCSKKTNLKKSSSRNDDYSITTCSCKLVADLIFSATFPVHILTRFIYFSLSS